MLSTAQPRRSWVEHIMGMPISVLARGPRALGATAEEAVRALYAELVDVDELFSPYRPDSAVSRLGRGELALADAPAAVIDVARRCDDARVLTGGLFDAMRPDGRWDPSGLVKGWAVEQAGRGLVPVADVDWCVNAGGDVLVLSPSGAPFHVGVQDPAHRQRVAAVIARSSGAVATSGTAARGEHLYDPLTGTAAVESASVTVTGPSLESADVLATAAFVAGRGAFDVVASLAGYEAMRVDLAGVVSATAGWPDA